MKHQIYLGVFLTTIRQVKALILDLSIKLISAEFFCDTRKNNFYDKSIF